jgi:hypothetical protein
MGAERRRLLRQGNGGRVTALAAGGNPDSVSSDGEVAGESLLCEEGES